MVSAAKALQRVLGDLLSPIFQMSSSEQLDYEPGRFLRRRKGLSKAEAATKPGQRFFLRPRSKPTSNPATKGLHADLGILEITLSVTTTARFQIDELRVENIKAASRIGAIELTDVVLPYEVFNLTLSQIGIETIEIPQLEVS
jgi:hypothetical protein